MLHMTGFGQLLLLSVIVLAMGALFRDSRRLLRITPPLAFPVFERNETAHHPAVRLNVSIMIRDHSIQSQRQAILTKPVELLPTTNESDHLLITESNFSSSIHGSEGMLLTALGETSRPSLWIHVEEFSEGMSSWRIGFAEILALAKKLNATLVEPCIQRGRLVSCQNRLRCVRLGHLYDMDKLRQVHQHIVSFEDYQKMLAVQKPTIFDTCFARQGGNPSPAVLCQAIPNLYGSKKVRVLEKAIAHDGAAVVRLQYYRKGGLQMAKWAGSQNLVPLKRVNRILDENFEFRKEHYTKVDSILRAMGISNTTPFDVIHWRAEVPRINYDMCTERILKAKHLLSPKNETPLILMSSLNLMSNFQWGDRLFRQQSANQGLRRLIDAGVRKIDQVKGLKMTDIVDLAAWDQIMALRSRRFTTCGRSCDKSHFCAACNYRGNFAQFAIDSRTKRGKESHDCWIE